MSASADDYFHKVGRSTATTLSAPGYTVGNASINVASTTNWPTSTGVTFAIDETDSDGNRISGTYNVFRGTVSGATQVNNLTYVGGDANRDYSAASTTRVYILVSSYRDNRFTDGILAEHNQDGTHSDVTADSIVVTGDVTAANFIQSGGAGSDGWTVGLPAVSTVTANGNRSYTATFGSSVASTLSEGMRIRTTRTVAAPTTSMQVNGYYNDTSVSGMTFTDDFVVGGWVYTGVYQSQIIASRYNGTSGWELRAEADGTIALYGFNAGAANFSKITSYQSIPLNKWVHVAAQLDMSGFAVAADKSYIMIDGVNVPAVVSRGGTNPIALIQAGNLEIGSRNGGLGRWSGYLSNIFVSSAKITQANIRILHSRALTTADTSAYSLVSAYTLATNGADLNTTNANNLTANGTINHLGHSPFGNQGVSSTLDYALVMDVDGTTVTLQVPEGCTIPTSGGVSAVAYSTQANPYGWVSDKGRWEVEWLQNTSISASGTTVSTVYNPGGSYLTKPSGRFDVHADINWQINYNSGTAIDFNAGISTSSTAFIQGKNAYSSYYMLGPANPVGQFRALYNLPSEYSAAFQNYYPLMAFWANTISIMLMAASISSANRYSQNRIWAIPSCL